MADETTTNLGLTKPELSESDVWGDKLNNNFDAIDAIMDSETPSTQAIGDSASAGTSLVAARADHKHAMPASIAEADLATNAVSTVKIADQAVTPAKLSASAATLFSYRRPVLEHVSATTVRVENNTGTANQTTILFPDGEARSVTEDTSSTHKYRLFTITATAEFTTGTEDSGMLTGESEADNTWYAIYAVKSLVDTTKFVLVGTTTVPLQANYSTLNTAFASNGWVYLGLIRNGDNSGTAGDILNFSASHKTTLFDNIAVGNFANAVGIRLATTASAASLAYTYAAGTGAAEIPGNIVHGIFTAARDAGTGSTPVVATVAGENYNINVGTSALLTRVKATCSKGIGLNNSSSVSMDIYFSGYEDQKL